MSVCRHFERTGSEAAQKEEPLKLQSLLRNAGRVELMDLGSPHIVPLEQADQLSAIHVRRLSSHLSWIGLLQRLCTFVPSQQLRTYSGAGCGPGRGTVTICWLSNT